MKERPYEPEKFPHYDDIWHIDSAAIDRGRHVTRGDPDATAYTEMYLEPSQILEKNAQSSNDRY